MDYYQASFYSLLALCAGLLASQPTSRRDSKLKAESEGDKKAAPGSKHPEGDWYKAYALVMAADWLQGPYLYSLYRDEHGLSPSLVSNLFTTGFVSSALSAYYVGALSDKHGRKLACTLFCVLYALSCSLTIIPSVPLLFLGRVLGGISTSILFSVFDTWMVANFRERKLVEAGCDLSRTYATTGTLNSFVAIVSGVVSELLVRYTGTKKAPFLLSAVLLCLAFRRIRGSWVENFGVDASSKSTNQTESPSLWAIFRQPSILALGFASTMFEGSMYLFVFFWAPALKSAQKQPAGELPYGFIFSSFMASSMAASLIFNIVMQRKIVRYSRLLIAIMLLANYCFVKLAGPKTGDATFWLFCLFEACIGMYYPCTGYLKGYLVEDNARAKVYSIMRLPLNIFVVVSLMILGDTENFNKVFGTCSVMLTASFGAVWAASLRGHMP